MLEIRTTVIKWWRYVWSAVSIASIVLMLAFTFSGVDDWERWHVAGRFGAVGFSLLGLAFDGALCACGVKFQPSGRIMAFLSVLTLLAGLLIVRFGTHCV
jgi:hypothetical protein